MEFCNNVAVETNSEVKLISYSIMDEQQIDFESKIDEHSIAKNDKLGNPIKILNFESLNDKKEEDTTLDEFTYKNHQDSTLDKLANKYNLDFDKFSNTLNLFITKNYNSNRNRPIDATDCFFCHEVQDAHLYCLDVEHHNGKACFICKTTMFQSFKQLKKLIFGFTKHGSIPLELLEVVDNWQLLESLTLNAHKENILKFVENDPRIKPYLNMKELCIMVHSNNIFYTFTTILPTLFPNLQVLRLIEYVQYVKDEISLLELLKNLPNLRVFETTIPIKEMDLEPILIEFGQNLEVSLN